MKQFRNQTFNSILLNYDHSVGGNVATKPILNSQAEELCFCVKHDRVMICEVNSVKPKKLINHPLYFTYLPDRQGYISLDLFTKEDEQAPSENKACGDWGYQVVLIVKDDYYLLEYQDGFITGDARGGDDFQEFTADWQW